MLEKESENKNKTSTANPNDVPRCRRDVKQRRRMLCIVLCREDNAGLVDSPLPALPA